MVVRALRSAENHFFDKNLPNFFFEKSQKSEKRDLGAENPEIFDFLCRNFKKNPLNPVQNQWGVLIQSLEFSYIRHSYIVINQYTSIESISPLNQYPPHWFQGFQGAQSCKPDLYIWARNRQSFLTIGLRVITRVIFVLSWSPRPPTQHVRAGEDQRRQKN